MVNFLAFRVLLMAEAPSSDDVIHQSACCQMVFYGLSPCLAGLEVLWIN